MSLRTLALTLLLSLGLLSGALHAAEHAPDFTLPGDKGTISLSQYKGQVVYLDFWASWCGPCRQSFPWMNEMQQRYGTKGFKVVAINLDKERDMIGKFVDATHPTFTIAYDAEGSVAEKYRVGGMPSSYLIDRNGNIQAQHMGFRDKDAGALEQSIQALLQ